MSAHEDEQSLTGPTAEEEAAAHADTGGAQEPEGQAPRMTDEERLARLAEQTTGRLTFASDRKTGEKVPLPGRPDEWFVPRPLTRAEVLKLESVQARARTWMKPGDTAERMRPVDTQAERDKYYAMLCGCGIEEYQFMSKGGLRRGKYAANPAGRDTEAACNELDPVLGEWLQLYLEVFNGISDEQRRARGNA